MELGLEDRRAVVTGGTRGIGRAVCEELVAEGASVAFCARDEREVREAEAALREAASREAASRSASGGGAGGSGSNAFGFVVDVRNAEEVQRFVADAAQALGGMDVLVNNAGAARPGSFETLSDEDWRDDLDVKLFSQIRCTRAALPYLRESRAPRVVNVNAVFAKSPDPSFFATSVNRAACGSLTKVLSQELAREGILVNSVNIGFVVTSQWENIRARQAPGTPAEEYFASVASAQIPLGRFGRVEEVSSVVVFLASDRASYVTGAMVDVAGGLGRAW